MPQFTQLTFDFTPSAKEAEKKKNSSPEILKVRELTQKIKKLLESGIGQVWVQGEISNYRKQTSGHHYFTLKDASAVLSCVLFAGDARFLKHPLRDGMEVQVAGEISVYEARGNYQLIIRHLQTCGEGALQIRFEALKRKLAAEGLFAPERKRILPKYPLRIAVITSPTGAALQDFLHVLWRRNPHIEVILNPVRVQGTGASQEIVRAIAQLNALEEPPLDAIVLTRGGGSLEDLWEFNEEVVARAIAGSRVPTVSAIGHEIDFTISDFAADVRAPTPSAAAELLAGESSQLLRYLDESHRRMLRICQERHSSLALLLTRIAAHSSFRYPERFLHSFSQRIDAQAESLTFLMQGAVEKLNQRLDRSTNVLKSHHPVRWIEAEREKLRNRAHRIQTTITYAISATKEKLSRSEQVLKAFDPRSILARGFTATFDSAGNLLKSAEEAIRSGTIITQFSDGKTVSQITNKGFFSEKHGEIPLKKEKKGIGSANG